MFPAHFQRESEMLDAFARKIGIRVFSTATFGQVGPTATIPKKPSAAGWSSMSLWQSGMLRPQPVEISRDARTIRGNEKVMEVQH
jgi:hypothetical protein